MKKFLNFFVLIIFVITLEAAEQDEVTLLRWTGPPGSKPGTFKEWISANPYSELSVIKSLEMGKIRAGEKVAILVEKSIASGLDGEISQLTSNLNSDGYSVLYYELSGGTPDSLRSVLCSLYVNDSIEGALFIGNLPVAWFQIKNDFDTYGYREWPIDLFYMDLDGEWIDSLKYDAVDTLVAGQDSIYDIHRGDLSPEIYVGRLTPTGIGNDTLLLQNYFLKDNRYRTDSIRLQERALFYIDDDWEVFAPSWSASVARIYNDTLLVTHPESTTAYRYRQRLDTVRAWVSVFAHSSPSGHSFYYSNRDSIDRYYSYEYTTQDPPANFYNHFACSFDRYTSNGYGGGRSIFNQSYGLASIGSTKTGSMLDFDSFYQPLSEGKNLGEAFRDWFTYILQNGVTFNELCWHYGMTLLGDPFLKPLGHSSGIEDVPVLSYNDFKISPIVSSRLSNVEIKCAFTSNIFADIKLYDCSGRFLKILFSGIIEKGSNKISLPLEEIESGVYFIKLENSEIKRVGKVIIL